MSRDHPITRYQMPRLTIPVWWYGIGMVKVTFTLDDATVAELRRTAARLKKPQSQVVREAVSEYSGRTDTLTERERLHKLAILDRFKHEKPTRSQAENDAEIAEIRAARRTGGRLHPVE